MDVIEAVGAVGAKGLYYPYKGTHDNWKYAKPVKKEEINDLFYKR